MLEALQRALAIPELKKRISYVLGMFAVFALGAHVPVPGIDPSMIARYLGRNANNLLGLIDVFSGGALKRMSIFAMGIASSRSSGSNPPTTMGTGNSRTRSSYSR